MEDMGWPSGTLALTNLDTRFRYAEGPPYGGGLYMFEYKGGTADLNKALVLFSQIAVPELQLVVHSGPGQVYATTADETETVDWRLTVWVPQNFYGLYRNPNGHTMADDPGYGGELPPPCVDMYLGENSPINFDDVIVPANVTVLDHRRPTGNLLKGVVYDLNSGKTLQAVSVMLVPTDAGIRPDPSLATATNEKGEYIFENVRDGHYQIEIRAYGYAPRQEGYFAGREHEYRETTTYLARSVDVTGTVVDEGACRSRASS
jgi:hypothetical protein